MGRDVHPREGSVGVHVHAHLVVVAVVSGRVSHFQADGRDPGGERGEGGEGKKI